MNVRGILLGTAVVLTLPTAAFAGNEGFYVGGAGGLNWTRDAKISSPLGAGSPTVKYDQGWVGSLSAGYETALGLRGEFEVNHRWGNDIDSTSPASATSGKVRSIGLMGNILYDIHTGTPFTPYIGVGAGAARVKHDVRFGAVSASDSDWVFAYQGIVGAAYNVTSNLAITADYRYFATAKPDYSFAGSPASARYHNHSVLVGLRWSFGAPAAAAPAVATPPAAPVTQAPQTEYLVFFDWNRADITAASDRIISDAAAAAGTLRAVGIHVIGHTDSSGQPAYNQKLSMRRADAVKRALVAKGVPVGQISVEGKGESQLMVATADNVREPSNRRAQILIRVR